MNPERTALIHLAIRLGYTYAEIGQALGISRQRIQQIWKRMAHGAPARPVLGQGQAGLASTLRRLSAANSAEASLLSEPEATPAGTGGA